MLRSGAIFEFPFQNLFGCTCSPGPTGLLKDLAKRHRNIPFREMTAALCEVANVADVIAFAVLVHILELHFLAADGSCNFKGFQYRDAVLPAAPEIVNLAAAGGFAELHDEPCHIMRVDVVPHLLALVAKDLIQAPFEIALHQATEEAMRLHTTVVWPRQAAST